MVVVDAQDRRLGRGNSLDLALVIDLAQGILRDLRDHGQKVPAVRCFMNRVFAREGQDNRHTQEQHRCRHPNARAIPERSSGSRKRQEHMHLISFQCQRPLAPAPANHPTSQRAPLLPARPSFFGSSEVLNQIRSKIDILSDDRIIKLSTVSLNSPAHIHSGQLSGALSTPSACRFIAHRHTAVTMTPSIIRRCCR